MPSRANLQSADRLLAPFVVDSVAALTLNDEDEAAAKLAVQYAEAIDEARYNAAWAERILGNLKKKFTFDDTDDWDYWEKRLTALEAKLSVQNTLKDLGPKLADLLADLGATPKARAAILRGQPTGKGTHTPRSDGLTSLRAELSGRHVG